MSEIAPTGDRGQRYEVRCYDRATGKEVVVGWTEEPSGGGLMRGARLWPKVRDPFVVDRQQSRSRE